MATQLVRLHSAALATLLLTTCTLAQGPSIGGFIPFLGLGMTDEFKTIDSMEDGIDLGGTFFIADAEFAIPADATQLGTDGTPYYDIALLDTGAATHIITQEAFDGFDLPGFDLTGTNTQAVGGATGVLEMTINDAAGVYVAGLGDRMAPSNDSLVMNDGVMRGQSSFATLTAPESWTLPNIVGLPMAMQHSIVIRNSDPQMFEHQGRTVRTPQIDLINVGDGAAEGITRRADLNIRPGIGFVQGPFYVYNLDFEDLLNSQLGGEIAFHDNPASPTVVQDQTGTGGSLFLDVDLKRGDNVKEEREFLFDTGADLTVISQTMAKRLGFDAVLDTPDFILEVEGSGGVATGVPGIFLDELNIVTIGGDFTMHNVPVAILDVTDVSDPGNVVDGIIGTHLFNGRDLVIDASPSLGVGGSGPSLYISDLVTTDFVWDTGAATAPWHTGGNWSANAVPGLLATTQVTNVSGANQSVVVASDAEANTLTVSGTATATIEVQIESGATLTTFGETKINHGGMIEIASGGTLDAQFVNIEQGVLRGGGDIFSGTGPITTPVRNIDGRVEVGDDAGDLQLSIDGDFSNLRTATLAFDLGGTDAGTTYDQLDVTRFAFVGGTLEVSLIGSFDPNVGDMFSLITAGVGVEGMFDSLDLPAGFLWDIDYNANSVVLSVIGLGLEGDFNRDGTVNLSDYTVWRDNFGGLYDASDYQKWKDNFGQSQPSVLLAGQTVPEPPTFTLLTMLLGGIAAKPRRIVG